MVFESGLLKACSSRTQILLPLYMGLFQNTVSLTIIMQAPALISAACAAGRTAQNRASLESKDDREAL